MKRAVCLLGFLLLLLAALVVLWSHRYEVVPGSPTWRLADMRDGVPDVAGAEWLGAGERSALRLWVDDAHPAVALRLAIPGIEPCAMLHLRYRLQARGLIQGEEKWQTGRVMIEWHPADGGAPEIDPVGGIVDDKVSEPAAMVAVSAYGPAIPALRLEHLGKSGGFTMSDLEIIPVRERTVWKTGRWLLAAGFLGWLYVCIRAWPGISRWRALAAAGVWLVMTIQFVIPGPWKIQRPLLMPDFRMGTGETTAQAAQAPSITAAVGPVIQSGGVSPSGKLLPQGQLTLRVRHLISKARPLLHVLLLLAPTLASAWIIGRDPTLWMAIPCAIAIELAQMAFGFAFDWLDLLDLLTNAIGIIAGLWLARRFPWTILLQEIRKRRPV